MILAKLCLILRTACCNSLPNSGNSRYLARTYNIYLVDLFSGRTVSRSADPGAVHKPPLFVRVHQKRSFGFKNVGKG